MDDTRGALLEFLTRQSMTAVQEFVEMNMFSGDAESGKHRQGGINHGRRAA